MKRFTIEQSDEEFYTSHSGISLVGLALNRFTSIPSGLAKAATSDDVISHADSIKSYCGLLAQAKSDFVAIVRNPFYLDSESGFDWTANPELTGHLIRFQLDSDFSLFFLSLV